MRDYFQPTIQRYLRRWRPTVRPATIQSKHYILHRFVTYLREHHPEVRHFNQIQRHPHIEGWIEQILGLKPVTRNNYIRSLRLFFEDIIRWQWTQAPPPGLLSNADLAPEEVCLPRPLPPELDQAVQKAFIEAGTFASMALLLLRYTGMRIGEMRALPLNALEPSGSDVFSLRVPVGKTHSQRLIPLDERSVELIRRIIAQRACRQKRRLPPRLRRLMMIDHFGRHIGKARYNCIIKELTEHIDTTERIYCHRLRHTFATEMARAGMPMPALMKLLGHKTPKMTMRYVQVAQVDVRQAYDQALPQLAVIRSVEDHTLPSLPAPSTPLPTSPGPDQPLKLMSTMIDRLESLRRDAPDPALAKQLQRFIKRMRKAGLDLKEIL